MKPKREQIKGIATKRSTSSIKAKVIEKRTVYATAEKASLLYEIITFEDGKGRKLKTILYDQDVEAFDEVIQENVEYEIYNAKLKTIPGQLTEDPGHRVHEIEFNRHTTVEPVVKGETSGGPHYLLIADIPTTIFISNLYDVVGIVMYVDRNCRITNVGRHALAVRDVVLVDQSSEQILIVETYGELALVECETLHAIAPSFLVVAFTALTPSFHQGFTLTTTALSFTVVNPLGEEAYALRTWGEANHHLLAATHRRISEERYPTPQHILTTIDQLLQQTGHSPLQDETLWLRAQLSEFAQFDVQFYFGCSKCDTPNTVAFGNSYPCIACNQETACSTPRMVVTFEATDGTGTCTFTAFNATAEKLLGIEALTLYTMPAQASADFRRLLGKH